MHGWCEGASASTWHALLATAGRSALQQSWAYGAAVEAAGHALCRLVWQEGGEARALALLLRRRLPLGFGVALVLRGPVWLQRPADVAMEGGMLRALLPWAARTAIVWQPDDGHGVSRRGGARRVWTGASTVLLDLAPSLTALRSSLHGKWRNGLRQAETAGLRVVSGGDGPHLAWLIAETERQRLQRGYAGPSPAFARCLASTSGKDALCLVAEQGDLPVAGMLFIRHGQSATYQMGATTAQGRRLRAHNRLLWTGIQALKERGCRTLDLGLVDTVNSPGIARFKLGTGGTPLTLAGSYLMPPRLWRRRQAA